jgi:hypothetical protein
VLSEWCMAYKKGGGEQNRCMFGDSLVSLAFRIS